ncbi:methyl-accepting chemotaxis protein [Geotalea toluenoxydans]|uniref:methyl-accepting chemotaxis protein n=1 Tax=Geotalea toluenoxydans TaxID=421624 RepID=UPI0006D08F7C|nr:methyl-accepting chemotaxis protein [Geotalea toluenoxydans]
MQSEQEGHGEKRNRFRRSLSRRFLLRLLFILFLGQCLTLGWSLHSNKKIQEADVKDKLTLCGKQLTAVAVVSRATFDFTYLGQLADEMIKDPDLVRITYIDNGVTIIDVKKPNPPADQLKMALPVLSGTERVGTIDFSYSHARVMGNILSQTMVSIVLTGVLFLLLGAFTIFFFNRDIGSKIALINANLNQVSSGDLTTRTKQFANDELGSISYGLDFVIGWLSTTVGRIKKISSNVADATNHLSRTFRTLIKGVTQQQESTGKALLSVQNSLVSQQQIINATEELLDLSRESTSALGDILSASQGVVDKMDRLSSHVDSSYGTIIGLSNAANEVASVAAKADGSVAAADLAVSGINSSVTRIAAIVRETTDVSEEMNSIIAEQGVKSVNDAIESMQKIDQLAASLSGTISSLGSRSNDIAKILEVIKEVTDQTKLLSLNAQILSGQAGEHGRPFSVVAAQMKELSNKTANSTTEIEAIVSAIQHEISLAVSSAIATSRMVAEGKTVAVKVNEALLQIRDASQRSTQMVSTIQDVTADQNQGLQGIVKAFDEIRELINEVNRTTGVENDGIKGLQQDFDTIREATRITRSASESQVESIQLISKNLTMANDKTCEIATASRKQREMSEELIVAMEKVSHISIDTVKGVKEVATRFGGISEAVNTLHREIEIIKTETDAEAGPETEVQIEFSPAASSI